MDMRPAFERAEKRAAALRLTVQELVTRSGVKPLNYWRAKNAKYKRHDTVVLILRAVERQLDAIEAERAK